MEMEIQREISLLACFDLLLLVDYIPPLGCKYVRTAVEQQQVLASSYLI